MRRLIFCLLIWTVSPSVAGTHVTVAELRDLVTSARRAGDSDEKLAEKLARIELTERFSGGGLPADPGPRTAEVLRVLADDSVFLAPPAELVPRDSPLQPEEQEALLEKTREYTLSYILTLPDFVCKRKTHRYDDIFQPLSPPIYRKLRPRDTTSSELTFSHGKESDAPQFVDRPTCGPIPEGLTSYGEFGSIIGALFAPDSETKTAWSHWEVLNGKRVAVFSYVVDSVHSRYTIVWCCRTYGRFRVPREARTAYEGELFVDADSGAILRITRKAKPPADFPTMRTDTAVEYGFVDIGGKSHLCPLRSVIASTASSSSARYHGWVLHYLNELEFSDYQKFVANSTLQFGAPPMGVGAAAAQPSAPPKEPLTAGGSASPAVPGCPAETASAPPETSLEAAPTPVKPVALLVQPARGGNLSLVRFSPDGRYVLAQDEFRVEVLTLEPFGELFRIPAEHAGKAQFTPDSREVVFIGSASHADAQRLDYVSLAARVERWSIRERGQASSTEIKSGPCRSQELSPDVRVLACVDFDGALHVYDVASGETVFEKAKFGRRFESADASGRLNRWGDAGSAQIEFSPDSRFVIVSPDAADGVPAAFDLRERTVMKLTGALKELRYTGFAFIAPDRVLMSGAHRGVWNPRKLDPVVEFPSGKVLSELEVPDGTLSRAADPAFVLIGSFEAAAGQAAEVSQATQALDLRTGQILGGKTRTMDVFGDRYVAERVLGELGLFGRGGTLQAAVKLRGPGQFTSGNDLVRTTGKVVRKGENRFVVETGDRRDVTMLVRESTRFLEGGRATGFQGIDVGKFVEVQSEETGDEEFRAVSVSIEPEKASETVAPVAGPAVKAVAGEQDPHRAFLDAARAVATELSATPPDFTCVETVTRLMRHKRGDAHWNLHDTLSAELAWTDGQETYRNVTIDGEKGEPENVPSHSWTIRQFSTVVDDVLSLASAARIEYRGDARMGQAVIYEYQIDGEHSHWLVTEGGQEIRPARTGKIWFDKGSTQALRVEFRALEIPKEFPADTLTLALDYDSVTLGSKTFLLPQHAELVGCARVTGWCTKDSVDFRDYRVVAH